MENEKSAAKDQADMVIAKYREAKERLRTFPSKEEAIQFLIKETKLPNQECSDAYDILLKIAE